MSRLVVVSNRVPWPKPGGARPGGLAMALLDALQERGGLWFGWSGEALPEPSESPHTTTRGPIEYATIDLSEQDYETYYLGFSNATLWPLCHYRLDLMHFDRQALEGYRRVNRQFAEHLVPRLRDDDVVWVHDYHLFPLGRELRDRGVEAPMGFFLHIPFPAHQVMAALPSHRRLVESLCAYDLVGFQTDSDLRAFQEYIVHEAEGTVHPDGTVEAFGRRLYADVFPIGIEPEQQAELAEEAVRSQQVAALRRSLAGRQLILGVDRLDYSKGLEQRLQAYERLLELYPAARAEVTYLQIAALSRTSVPEYRDIRQQLESRAGRINARYGESDWTPLRYLNRDYSRRAVAGFLRTSRIGLITPLRDGMNLVAKEFVAAQAPEDPGVLVLSRFAGAARELDAAVVVNPYDPDGLAEAIQSGLEMPRGERRERWQSMMEVIRTNSIHAWSDGFLEHLDRAARDARR